jgi:hypothetical protein
MEGEKDSTEAKAREEAPAPEKPADEIPKGTRERITGVIAEKFLPEVIKRGLEASLEAILKPDSGLKRVIPDLRIRREMAEYLIRQIDETKNMALRVIAHEVRSFLENTNMEDAVRKVLTSMAFEVKTEVRFVDTGDGQLRPSVRSGMAKMTPLQKKKRPPRKKTPKK